MFEFTSATRLHRAASGGMIGCANGYTCSDRFHSANAIVRELSSHLANRFWVLSKVSGI